MLVRDRLYKISEVLGRPTEAADGFCPCRVCYSPHDCGYRSAAGGWVDRMVCVTRWREGCANALPEVRHIMKRGRCARCGTAA